jgi:hypothetical protein
LNALFIVQLALSFAVGGLWVVCATVLADRLGPKVGGLISGLPSTVALGLFFLAWTQSPGTAVQAASVVPLVAGINSLFCATYAHLVRKDIRPALLFSLALWFLSAYVLVRTRFDSYAVSLLGFGSLFLLSFFLMEHVFKIASIKGKAVRYRPRLILARAFAGGLAVSVAVYLGKTAGPLWGGIFSTFPAMFISTMLVTYFAQGALFSAGIMKSTMLSGLSVAVYAVVVRWTFLPLGPWAGTLIAILVSYASALTIFRFVIQRTR